MTNAHLEGYNPEANIRISKGLGTLFRGFSQAPDRAASKPHYVASG